MIFGPPFRDEKWFPALRCHVWNPRRSKRMVSFDQGFQRDVLWLVSMRLKGLQKATLCDPCGSSHPKINFLVPCGRKNNGPNSPSVPFKKTALWVAFPQVFDRKDVARIPQQAEVGGL